MSINLSEIIAYILAIVIGSMLHYFSKDSRSTSDKVISVVMLICVIVALVGIVISLFLS